MAPPPHCPQPLVVGFFGMSSKLKSQNGGVSIPREVRVAGIARAKALGLRSFSAYLTLLVQNDTRAPDEPFVIHVAPRIKR